MDAHLFRRFCDALIPTLPGARVEKIHQPGQGVTTFALYGAPEGLPKKRHLVLKADRKAPFLFVADHRVPVNAHPPAMVMRLRKYLFDRRILGAVSHWTERRLYLEILPETTIGPLWLCLDLREGPALLFEIPPPFAGPQWPGPELSPPVLCEGETWRDWPVLTPALRRTLPYLEPEDASALLMDLESGGGDIFLYENEAGRREVSAWPLPAAQLARLGKNSGPWHESVWEYPERPLALAGESQVYAELVTQARQEAAKPHSAEASRLSRLQAKLEREEQRLRDMCAKQRPALLLQSQLYRFAPEQKQSAVSLDTPEGPLEQTLDPRLTIRENMAALFHQAGRGKRGLEHLSARRSAVDAEKASAMDAMLRSAASLKGTAPAHAHNALAQGGKSRPAAGLPKQVQAFRSSDGFLILRGRDTRGNGMALKLAAPHDYWLHTAQGPSAHVIIRRDHAGQEVPERTMREAGALAALKSWLKDEERAEIQYSLAKHIHGMKKAGPGMVRIDKSEGTFWAEIDPGLEGALGLG